MAANPDKYKQICVRMSPKMRRLLKKVAHRRERSVNDLLVLLARQEIEKEPDLAVELVEE